jgi:hypothetical protein
MKKLNNTTVVVFLGLLLTVLVGTYAYLQWQKKQVAQVLQTDTIAMPDSTAQTENMDTATIADTATRSASKEKDKRVYMDISDPIDPADPLEPIPIEESDPLVVNSTPADTTPPVFEMVEKMPTYIGGEDSLLLFIAKNFVCPKEEVAFGSKVYVGFIVEKDGTPSNVQVLKTFSETAGAEAMRVTKLTKWKPGELHGKPVRVKMRIPFIVCYK